MAINGGLFGKEQVRAVAAPQVIILTAVLAEAAALRRAVADLPVVPPVIPIGIGAVRPRPMLRGSRLMIMAGLAGALDPTLTVGDVVIDDPAGVVPTQIACRRARVHTSPTLILTPAGKAECFVRTEAAVVDMEQAIAFEWARAAGVACVGVRAISDTAEESLDRALLRFVNEMGQVKPLPLLFGLAARPSRVQGLIRLGQNAARANRKLGDAVRQIVCAARIP